LNITPVGHAHDDLPAAILRHLKHTGAGQFFQCHDFLFVSKNGTVFDRLHSFLEPPLFRRILQVHVFHADGTAIGFFEPAENVPEPGLAGVRKYAGIK